MLQCVQDKGREVIKMKKISEFDTQIQSDELAEIINYNDRFEDPRYQDEE